MAVLLGLFFAPVAMAESNEKAQKTPDETPNDHPSGKDRTDKPTEGKPQGASATDPDGDSNDGADKPTMAGGFDADKDGNNGGGNDDDFEDDNNGWCRGKPTVSAASDDDDDDDTQSTSVLGVTLERTLSAESPAVLSAQVAAASAPTAAAPAGALAATGQNLDLMAAMGVMLLAVGSVCVTLGRRRVVPIKVRVNT